MLNLLVRVFGIALLGQSQTDNRGGGRALFFVELQLRSESLETQP